MKLSLDVDSGNITVHDVACRLTFQTTMFEKENSKNKHSSGAEKCVLIKTYKTALKKKKWPDSINFSN